MTENRTSVSSYVTCKGKVRRGKRDSERKSATEHWTKIYLTTRESTRRGLGTFLLDQGSCHWPTRKSRNVILLALLLTQTQHLVQAARAQFQHIVQAARAQFQHIVQAARALVEDQIVVNVEEEGKGV
jgi:hypothetical protein